MTSFRGSNRSRGAALVTVVLVVLAVMLVLLVVANAFSSYRLKTVRNNWDEVFGSWDDVMQRYPATEANAAALELERIGMTLGLNLAPRLVERVGPLPEEQRAEFEQVKSEVWQDYLAKQLELPRRGELQPPPEILTSYIGSHEEELRALHAHLAGGSVPVWESDLSRNAAAPIPNLLAHIDLQKLLGSVALARMHAGDRQGALAAVESAWLFSRSLRDSPILISQLIYIGGTRIQVGALRQIPDVDEVWLDRLVQHDARASFATAMKYEGWFWLFVDETWSYTSGMPLSTRLTHPFARPYTQLCVADVSDAWRERIIRLEHVAVLCDRDLSLEGADLAIEVPRWNALGSLFNLNLAGSIDHLARLELDIELTRLLIEADTARRANEDAWPENLSGSRSCATCPDDLWNYEVNGDALEIGLSRDVAWPEQGGFVLPIRFTIDYGHASGWLP